MIKNSARHTILSFILSSLTIIFLLPLVLQAQPQPILNAAETQLALQKLSTLGSALYIAAHPDDENTALLSYLSSERRLRTAYLSITRGDGGQNLIGTEQGARLGLIRTQELLAARRIDGAEQFFTRAIDFGFSKSAEETLRLWGRENILADVVWVIRRFRPDVMITRFNPSGTGGHGHHTASAILAGEAFQAAGDPSRFPEQLRYVQPWKPKRLLWNSSNRPPTNNQTLASTPVEPSTPARVSQLISVDVGAYNPLLGKSYTEIAALSRSMHKSQGFGSAERRGRALNNFEHVAGEAPEQDIFDGVETTWRRVKGGETIGKLLEEAARSFQPANPPASLPLLLRIHAEMNKLPASESWIAVKRRELLEVIRACAGLWIEAIAKESVATPGSEVSITTTLVNRSAYPLRLKSIAVPGAPAQVVNAELTNNQPVQTQMAARVPANAEASQPYWLRQSAAEPRSIFDVAHQEQIGTPENAPAWSVTCTLSHNETDELTFETPVLFRWTDRVRGELYRPLEIVPPVAINLEESVYLFPDGKPKNIKISLQSNEADVSGTLTLRLPSGWRAMPETIPVSFKNRSDEFNATFSVTPPVHATAGALVAELALSGRQARPLSQGMLRIEYPHIPVQLLFPPAAAKLVRLDLQRRGQHIGYIMGSGDEIPASLRQVGYHVTLLSDDDLDQADLKSFDTIITGVRAYNTRARLRQRQPRLLEYVAGGGTLIVQYNTNEEAMIKNLGPYPFKISRSDRVTVEEAPVKFLAPEHPLLNVPNKITAADFAGWIQERGLYFPNEWDAQYQTLLASHDPGEPEMRGGTLVAPYGKGTYIYTSYAWFRQLPAGVPGAYRIFVNMIAAGK